MAIYHERVTLLVQLTEFDIQENRVDFKARIIKPLNKSHAEKHTAYRFMMSKEEIEFGSIYLIPGNESIPLLKGSFLGRPYSPFLLWLDPELTRFVLEQEDEVTSKIPSYILQGEDWRVLKKD